MRKFQVGGGYSIKDVVELEQICKGSKQGHLKRLSEESGVALEDMLFIDNERGNCIDVSAIGECSGIATGI